MPIRQSDDIPGFHRETFFGSLDKITRIMPDSFGAGRFCSFGQSCLKNSALVAWWFDGLICVISRPDTFYEIHTL